MSQVSWDMVNYCTLWNFCHNALSILAHVTTERTALFLRGWILRTMQGKLYLQFPTTVMDYTALIIRSWQQSGLWHFRKSTYNFSLSLDPDNKLFNANQLTFALCLYIILHIGSLMSFKLSVLLHITRNSNNN